MVILWCRRRSRRRDVTLQIQTKSLRYKPKPTVAAATSTLLLPHACCDVGDDSLWTYLDFLFSLLLLPMRPCSVSTGISVDKGFSEKLRNVLF